MSKISRARDELSALKRELETLMVALERRPESATGLIRKVDALLTSCNSSLEEVQANLDSQQEEHENLKALQKVSQVVNSSLDLSEVLNLAMDSVIQVTGAERGYLMLFNEETGELDFKVARNMDRETIDSSSFEISRSIVNRVAQTGEAIVTTNAQADPRFSSQASVVSYSLRSILCVPLRVKDKITGVIYTDNRIKSGLFSDRDRDLLAAVANQAAIGIENARLFERLKRNLEEITNMKNIMDNIFASITSGVITTDMGDQITLFNRAAEAILKIPARKAQGAHYREILAPFQKTSLPSLVENVKTKERKYIAEEIESELPGRGPVNLSMSLSPLKDANNETLGVAIVLDDLTEKKRLEAVREIFRRYVSPAVVDRLPADPAKLKLGGTRQELSILFADIRGFTSFSEPLAPEELVGILNKYLGLAADAVLQFEGTLDKFMGDAVMAIFNAPLPQQDHPLRAVKAALTMRQAIAKYHRQEGVPRLQYGIGINVGEAVVGNIGAAAQMNYTAIGDDVNLAKRIQENAKGGQILLSQSAYERVKEHVEARCLGLLQVKGRKEAVEVYELIGLKD
ncbi:MAG: adenylate/guanylate cyclase domain-containing protein [Anaerolineae bacterium]